MTHMPTTFDRPTLAHPTLARPLPPLSAPLTAPLAAPVQAPIPAATIPVHDAQDLTGGGPVAHIRLDGQTYTLRITRQGKLILTK